MAEQLSVELSARVNNFIQGMRSASASTREAEGKITKSTNAIGDAVKSNLAGVFSAAAVIGFGKAVLSVTADFQKFNAVLGNTLGSASLASLKLKEIQDFAEKTPFGVNELTGAFVKLANSGFKPTGDQMRALGDLAASTGKSFDQLAEAILDAQSGEFERLKEFGVRAKDAGDSVIFTYKGVQTQVEKTSEAIRNYVTNLGNAEGTSGSMAKISATLGGQISNLGDSWDKMLLSVGSNTEGIFNKSIGLISASIDKLTEFNRELEIASKYKLDKQGGIKDIFETLYKYSAGGIAGGNKQTSAEGQAGAIANAQDSVSRFVAKAIDGAKATSDFGKALADLKKKGDETLKGISNPGILRGVSDAYQQGVKAIQDARASFGQQVSTGDANFGTAKAVKGVKSLTDVLKELATALLLNDNQFRSTFSERNEGAIAAHQSAVDSLLKNGYSPLSKEVLVLKKAMQDLLQLPELPDVSANTGIEAPRNSKGNKEGLSIVGQSDTDFFAGFSDKEQQVYEAQARILLSQERFNEQFNEILNGGLAEGLGTLGSAIGEALANGGNVMEAAGQSLLSSLGGILIELGKLAIATGVGIAAVKKALQSLNPVVAIGAGVALIALGSMFRSKAASIGGGKNSSNGGEASRSIPQFASGVQNFRGGLALVGEQGPELVNLPTGASVMPNGPTQRALRGSGSPVVVGGEMRISMRQLVIALRSEEKLMGRTI